MANNKVIFGNQTIIDLTDATLDKDNSDQILSGGTAYGNDGEKITGTCTFNADTTDADVSASEVLSGKTFYGASGAKQVGTMPNKGGESGVIDDVATPYSISAGYHDGSGTVSVDPTEAAKLIPGNIKAGVEVMGVTGDYSGEDVKAQAKTATPYTTQQVILPDAGYDYLSQVTVGAIKYTETPNQYGTTVIIGDVAP